MMMASLHEMTRVGKGIAYTFADISKCFDRIWLHDAHYFLCKFHGDPKAIKVLSILLGTNKLKLQGSQKTFTIHGGLGQGGVTVGRSSSASISETMERNASCHPCPMIYNGEDICNQGYIDDTATSDNNVLGVKYSCKIIEETLDELSLEAHPTKTVHVICGAPEWIEKTKDYLSKNPATIQNFKVKISDSEKYLGLKIVSGTMSDIVNANIKVKASKIHQVATEIRQEVRDPRIVRIGSLRASAVLIQSKVIPILTYGTESWLHVTSDQYKAMEEIMATAMTRILSLPSSTVYDALLLEVSNYHIEVWMDCLKLGYFLKKLHIKKRGKLYRALRADIINDNEHGFIGDIRNLCDKYKIPDITLTPVTKEFIRLTCRDFSRRRSMMVTLNLKKIPPMLTLDKVWHAHYDYPPFEARAITAYRTGNLVFKNWAPYKFPKKQRGDKTCLFQPCQEEDSLKHVLQCEYYDTKFIEIDDPTRDLASYLVRLHEERMKKFSQPLICCEGWLTTRD